MLANIYYMKLLTRYSLFKLVMISLNTSVLI